MEELIWDSKGYIKLGHDDSAQEDWNQTLMTLINQESSKIHKTTFRYGADTILINPNLYPLFKTLSYYNDETKMLMDYSIIISESIGLNIIQLTSKKAIINLYISFVVTINSEITQLKFKPIYDCTAKEIGDYYTALSSKIKVDNYS